VDGPSGPFRCPQTARVTDLIRLSRGLHRPAATVTELTDRCAAFLDVLPPGTVVGGITAARLHGLWLPRARDDELLELIVTRAGHRPHELCGSRRREARVRRRALRRDEIADVDGLPVTAEARTWVDLAEALCAADLVAAGDSVLRGQVSDGELVAAVHRAQHRRGVKRARQALPLLDARSRSRPESWLRWALVHGGLPYPEVNKPIYTARGEWLAEPDLHYRRARLALEYNGADHASVVRMRRDITRGIDVEDDGWRMIVFGPAEVFGRTHRIAPRVRGLLDERDPGWARRLRPASEDRGDM